MRVLLASILLIHLIYAVCAGSDDSSLLSNRVLGTIATSCGKIPYHTPLSVPYPTGELTRPVWIPGPKPACVHDLTEALQYCRQVYATEHSDSVMRAIPNPFYLSNHSLPPYPSAISASVKIYLCLGSSSSSSSSISADWIRSPESKSTTTSPTHHLPSLIDVHKAYFAERFRQLANETRTNVSRAIQQLRQTSEGLARLHRSDPDLVRYSTSLMLQDVRKRLERIWANEASEWSRLEQERHEDLVKQLDSEDWAGENEFTYVLQEFNLDLDRVQDALSNLLNRLADSVAEEVRHLRLVQSMQPWTLSSNHTNWTNHITHEFTNIERVHEVLLKYVRTASLAINTVRSLMIKRHGNSDSLRSHITYKSSVLSSYNRLQSELFTAEAALSEAKSTLLKNVTERMHSLLRQMHNNLSFNNDTVATISDSYVMDWLRSVHHADLAFIDLLVSRILNSYASPSKFEPPTISYSADPVWRPVHDVNAATVSANELSDDSSDSQPLRKLFLHPVLVLLLAALVCLIVTLTLLTICLSLRYRRSGRQRRRSWFDFVLSAGAHKLKHVYRSRFMRPRKTVRPSTPTWKVERRVVVIANGLPTACAAIPELEHTSPVSQGYTNPICPSC